MIINQKQYNKIKHLLPTQHGNVSMGKIKAFGELIAMLDAEGAVVAADALHCNQKSAETVIEARADGQ